MLRDNWVQTKLCEHNCKKFIKNCGSKNTPIWKESRFVFGQINAKPKKKKRIALWFCLARPIKLRDNGVVANSCKYHCIEWLKVWTKTFCQIKFPYWTENDKFFLLLSNDNIFHSYQIIEAYHIVVNKIVRHLSYHIFLLSLKNIFDENTIICFLMSFRSFETFFLVSRYYFVMYQFLINTWFSLIFEKDILMLVHAKINSLSSSDNIPFHVSLIY